MKTTYRVCALLLAIVLAACSTNPPSITPAQVSPVETWGSSTKVTNLKHLYLASQPSLESLAAAKERNIGVIINLREPSEYDWDEEAAATSLGFTYYNLPIPSSAPFSPATIKQVDSLVNRHSNQKILIHCSSGNRAAGWLAIHLVKQHNLETSQAMDIANKAGITKQAIREKVHDYLTQHITEGYSRDLTKTQ